MLAVFVVVKFARPYPAASLSNDSNASYLNRGQKFTSYISFLFDAHVFG